MYYLINLAPPKVSLLSGGTPPKILRKRPPPGGSEKTPPSSRISRAHVCIGANVNYGARRSRAISSLCTVPKISDYAQFHSQTFCMHFSMKEISAAFHPQNMIMHRSKDCFSALFLGRNLCTCPWEELFGFCTISWIMYVLFRLYSSAPP